MTPLANIAYPIKKDQEESLLAYVREIITSRTNLRLLRTKFELCDRIVSREPKKGEKRLEVTAPIVMPQTDTMVAYLTSIFLNTPSIFPVTTAPDAQEIADAVNTLFKSFAKDWQWKRNLLLCFKNASKYDIMAAECTWKATKVGTVSNEPIVSGKTVQRAVTETVKEGFSITHLDPYNTFWDTSVPAALLAEEGEFAGYFERKSSIQLHKYLLSLPVNNGYNHRLKEIKESQASCNNYYTPNIVDYDPQTGITNWDEHFNSMLNVATGASNSHEVTTIYCRIVPSDFGMDVPAKGTPQIWKFVIVNMSYIVYAECKSNAHDYLPIVLGQPFESNLKYQQKALPEELATLQDLASKLWSMEIASSRRIVANREVYNPLLIRGEDINNMSESAKIPLRNAAYNQDIRQAIYSIPYNDPAIGTRSSLAQGIAQFASIVTGQNQVSNGQFVKGNKTNSQFDEVLARSDSRQVAMAVLLEDQFFGVLKHILLYDLLQYQQPMKVFDIESKQEIEVAPEKFLDTTIEFTINDSLSIGEDRVAPETIMTGMQTIQAIPQLQQSYDMGKLFSYLMSLSGAKHLDNFLVKQQPQSTPEQQIVATQQQQPPASSTNSPVDESQYQQQVNQALGAIDGNQVPTTDSQSGGGVPQQ